MAIPLIAAGIGAAANMIGGMAAGDAQRAAANKAYAAQKENFIKMQEMLEEIGIPSTEAQKLLLERPDYAGDLIVEKLGPSALDEIKEDPRLKNAQLDALTQLQEIGQVGLTPEERAQRAEILRESAAQGQSAQKGVLQNMAQRGTLDSGSALIAQLQANAQENADARRQSEQLAADVAQRRRDAIMQAANLSGNMSQTDLARQQANASAADRIAQFNVQNQNQAQQRNLDAKQAYQNQLANLANQEQQYNKQLIQQRYNQELDRWKSLGNLSTGQANASAQAAREKGAASAQQSSQMGSSIGNIATSVGGYYGSKGK
jgi:hypothetical protein